MKLLLTILIILLAGFSLSTEAQRYVDVEPDASGEIGALNNAITNDTEADANTIYRLRRGGIYFLNGPVINTILPLKIEAEEGNGDLPQLVPGLTIDGTSDVPFRPQNDLYLKNLSITARAQGGGLENQIIRIQAEDIRLEVDSCRIDESSQSFIRTDTRGTRIFLSNSIVSRIGTPDDIDNGRVVDDRGNFIDTLVMENNTIYNISSRVIRNGAGSDSHINKLVFNHNTVMNVGQRMADFGPVIDFICTNNIIVNPAFNGIEVNPDPFDPTRPDPNAERGTPAFVLDSVSQDILTMAGVAQRATVSNNNIYYTQNLLEARPTQNPDPAIDNFIVNRPTFSLAIEAFMELNGTTDSNIEEIITFQNAPPDPTVFTRQFWNNFDGSIQLDEWDNTGAPFSFSYPEATISATASTTSGQLGDLNWPLQVISREALEELIEEADTLLAQSTIGFNIGTIPQDFADSLLTTIDLAKTILADPLSTEADISAMIDTLQNAIDYFLSGIITSINEQGNRKLTVFPNPVINRLYIKGDGISNIQVRDISGRIRVNETVNRNSIELDISQYKQGLYFILIAKNDGSMITHKIIKQ